MSLFYQLSYNDKIEVRCKTGGNVVIGLYKDIEEKDGKSFVHLVFEDNGCGYESANINVDDITLLFKCKKVNE